jgi:DNA polymerase III alpha subunit
VRGGRQAEALDRVQRPAPTRRQSAHHGHRGEGKRGRVRVAGLCVVHQAPPTAKGFHFLTLEDEWGMINVIVSPRLVVHDGQHLHGGLVLMVEGMAQREAEVIN